MKTFYDQIELLAKILLGCASMCYVIGLIVLNIHFSQFGFCSFDLLQLNYIFAGLWCIIVFGCTALTIELGLNFFQSAKSSKGKYWKVIVFVAYTIFWLLCAYCFSVLADRLKIELNEDWTSLIGTAFLLYLFLGGKIKELVSASEFTLGHFLNEVPSLLFSSSLAIGYLLWFGSQIYKTIPANVGGGKPISVDVVFENDIKQILFPPDTSKVDWTIKADSIKNIDLNRESRWNQPFTLKLVAVINDSYYFSCESDTVKLNFSVNKGAIKILFYKRNNDLRRHITSGLYVRFRASGSTLT